MKKLICPSDFSTPSLNALTYAMGLADRLKAELIVLHAVHPVPVVDHSFLDLPDNPVEDARKEALQALANAGIATDAFQLEVRQGLASDLIVSYAKETEADLVVMGTKGASGIKEIILGSVASSVINRSEIPVLVVPEEAHNPDISTIVFAADFKKEDKTVAHQLLTFAKAFDAEICALHFLEAEEDERDFDDREEWRLAYPELFKYKKIRYESIRTREIVSGIDAYTQKINADVLTMMPRKRSFFEKVFHRSVTRQLACHTHIPLLAIHQ